MMEHEYHNPVEYTKRLKTENQKLKKQVEILKPIVEMVEDHRKMPHKHSHSRDKLYCLTERASEALEKIKELE